MKIEFFLGIVVGVCCTLMIEAVCTALVWCIVRCFYEKSENTRKESRKKQVQKNGERQTPREEIRSRKEF